MVLYLISLIAPTFQQLQPGVWPNKISNCQNHRDINSLLPVITTGKRQINCKMLDEIKWLGILCFPMYWYTNIPNKKLNPKQKNVSKAFCLILTRSPLLIQKCKTLFSFNCPQTHSSHKTVALYCSFSYSFVS